MTKNQTLSLIAFSAVMVLVGFQNCAKVGVQDVASLDSKMMTNGMVADSDPVVNPPVISAGDPVIDQGAPSMPIDPPVSTDHPMSTDHPTDVVQTPGTDVSIPKVPDEPVSTPVKNDDSAPVVTDSGDVQTPSAPDKHDEPAVQPPVVSTDDSHSSDDSVDMPESDAAALCTESIKGESMKDQGIKKLLTGSTFEDVNGSVLIESDHIVRAVNLRGMRVIRGTSKSSSADLISDVRGATVICGMNVEKIEDVRGNLILVNSTVQSLSNQRGAIRLMNSEIKNSSDVDSNIKSISK